MIAIGKGSGPHEAVKQNPEASSFSEGEEGELSQGRVPSPAFLGKVGDFRARIRRDLLAQIRQAKDVYEAIHKVLSWLEGLNDSAASSLRGGLEEKLTVHGSGVQGALRKTWVTTDPVESPFDTVATQPEV